MTSTHIDYLRSIQSRVADRFWSKVQVCGDNECWQWTSAIGGSGYGFFWVGGKKRSEFAHRLVVIWRGETIPPGPGWHVMHSCDNKLCVNPAHLSVGKNQDNRADCVAKKRHAVGEKNGGGGKLRDAQVKEIKGLQRDGWGCSRLSKRFGVSMQTIKAIKRGRIWSHIA